jgi:hypothetical protein
LCFEKNQKLLAHFFSKPREQFLGENSGFRVFFFLNQKINMNSTQLKHAIETCFLEETSKINTAQSFSLFLDFVLVGLLVLSLFSNFRKPRAAIIVFQDTRNYKRVIDILKKYGDWQKIEYDVTLAKAELEKESPENTFAAACLDVINEKDVKPYDIEGATSLDMNFVLFFLSKGKYEFFEENEKFGESSMSISGASASWASKTIRKCRPEFFSKTETKK